MFKIGDIVKIKNEDFSGTGVLIRLFCNGWWDIIIDFGIMGKTEIRVQEKHIDHINARGTSIFDLIREELNR